MSNTNVMVTFKAQLPFTVMQREKWFLASCSLLDVHSQGLTADEAENNLREALELFLLSCFERGTLEKVMKDCGFIPYFAALQGDVIPKTPASEKTIEVPIPFMVPADR
ncbi:hypothetical protein LLG96_01520 [bacterium]|nr:hypothetical protein [bacterium]